MHLIVCVDNHLGMAFNGRRQSRDRVLCSRISALASGSRLLMAPGSGLLFENQPVILDPDYLASARDGDYCFAEFPPLAAWEDRAERLILCRWNRVYPADQFLDLELSRWHKISQEDFPGSSHETITMEVYEK